MNKLNPAGPASLPGTCRLSYLKYGPPDEPYRPASTSADSMPPLLQIHASTKTGGWAYNLCLIANKQLNLNSCCASMNFACADIPKMCNVVLTSNTEEFCHEESKEQHTVNDYFFNGRHGTECH